MIKIANNLHLDGSKVYSYSTHVATISGNQLIENGKYSNSTTKHIAKIANMYGLQIVKSNDRPKFDKLPWGVNVKL